jgi:hypothetical protein
MPVQTVFDNLEAGMSLQEITQVFDVKPDEVRAVLRFASKSLEEGPSLRLMKILFDNGTPAPIAGSLVGHSVTRARQIGWEALKNGVSHLGRQREPPT